MSLHKEMMPFRAERGQRKHRVPDCCEDEPGSRMIQAAGSALCYRSSGVKAVWLVQGDNRWGVLGAMWSSHRIDGGLSKGRGVDDEEEEAQLPQTQQRWYN